MKLQDAISVLENIAPLSLAQDWDNVGLLMGDRDASLRTIMLAVDVTSGVIAEARRYNVDLIVSYHPPIFDPIKRITAQGPTAGLYTLLSNGIGVYSLHTALDVAQGGVNDGLADALQIQEPEPISDFVENPDGPHYKLVTFVPHADLPMVAEALYQAGAGRIGNYSHCGFQTEGTGTFLPLDGANPTIGKPGRQETVAETKLESVIQARHMPAVLAALRRAHPYETPAFDVFRHYDLEQCLGLGRIGMLDKPVKIPILLERLKKLTGTQAVGLIGPENRTVKKAAVCAGSCGSLLQKVIDRGCQFYVTGELKHHLALVAAEAGLTVACLSHTVSERFILKTLAKQLKQALPDVTVRVSKKDKDPFHWKTL